eukprot:GHVH01001148.1.p1 GENE.GHVH01001148.1~~GHVH01001148.1.p1  ORF type:complete len:942 (+),score=104.73 GHVH01001148.1:76-2826(+)
MTSIALMASAGAALVIARKKVEHENRNKWRGAICLRSDFPFELGTPITLGVFPRTMMSFQWEADHLPQGLLVPNRIDSKSSEESSCSPISALSDDENVQRLDNQTDGTDSISELQNAPVTIAIAKYHPGSIINENLGTHLGHLLYILDTDGLPIMNFISMEMHEVEGSRFSFDKFYRLLKSTDRRVRPTSPISWCSITNQKWLKGKVSGSDECSNTMPVHLHVGRSFALLGWQSTMETPNEPSSSYSTPYGSDAEDSLDLDLMKNSRDEVDEPVAIQSKELTVVSSSTHHKSFNLSRFRPPKMEPPKAIRSHVTVGIWSSLAEATGHGIEEVTNIVSNHSSHIDETLKSESADKDSSTSPPPPSIAPVTNGLDSVYLSLIRFDRPHELGLRYLSAIGGKVVLLPMKRRGVGTGQFPSSIVYPIIWGLCPSTTLAHSFEKPVFNECYLRLCIGRFEYCMVPLEANDFIWMSRHPEVAPSLPLSDLASPIKEFHNAQNRHSWRSYVVLEEVTEDGMLVRASLRVPNGVLIEDMSRTIIDLKITTNNPSLSPMSASYSMLRIACDDSGKDMLRSMKQIMSPRSFNNAQKRVKGHGPDSLSNFLSPHLKKFADHIVDCHGQLDDLPALASRPWHTTCGSGQYEVVLSTEMLRHIEKNSARMTSGGYPILKKGRLLAGIVVSSEVSSLSTSNVERLSLRLLIWRDASSDIRPRQPVISATIPCVKGGGDSLTAIPSVVPSESSAARDLDQFEVHQLSLSTQVFIPKHPSRGWAQYITGGGATSAKMIALFQLEALFRFDTSFLAAVPTKFIRKTVDEQVAQPNSVAVTPCESEEEVDAKIPIHLPLVLVDPLQQLRNSEDGPANSKGCVGSYYSVTEGFKKVLTCSLPATPTRGFDKTDVASDNFNETDLNFSIVEQQFSG